ncbi:uncharacterized protein CLUP02_13921 [Colletotrichum lupini]|uniref:Uncharacterized protein n=1 Tax=Colletotrichum lupini TaxID=145971 RepID=A0A9Q8T554_9PEZI|nr:uncharacterized protein CLUP02_13921 [Colletotrichum lupini]UQC88397.1 hypothetical protein CLUP02_13921 [Colletotrichum lupini]
MGPTQVITHIHTRPRVVRMQGTNTSTVVANRSERGTSPVSRFQMGNFGQARGGTVGTTNRRLAWLLNPPLGCGAILTALLRGHVSVFSWQINQITIPLSTSSEDVVMASTSDLPPAPTPHLRGYPHGWPSLDVSVPERCVFRIYWSPVHVPTHHISIRHEGLSSGFPARARTKPSDDPFLSSHALPSCLASPPTMRLFRLVSLHVAPGEPARFRLSRALRSLSAVPPPRTSRRRSRGHSRHTNNAKLLPTPKQTPLPPLQALVNVGHLHTVQQNPRRPSNHVSSCSAETLARGPPPEHNVTFTGAPTNSEQQINLPSSRRLTGHATIQHINLRRKALSCARERRAHLDLCQQPTHLTDNRNDTPEGAQPAPTSSSPRSAAVDPSYLPYLNANASPCPRHHAKMMHTPPLHRTRFPCLESSLRFSPFGSRDSVCASLQCKRSIKTTHMTVLLAFRRRLLASTRETTGPKILPQLHDIREATDTLTFLNIIRLCCALVVYTRHNCDHHSITCRRGIFLMHRTPIPLHLQLPKASRSALSAHQHHLIDLNPFEHASLLTPCPPQTSNRLNFRHPAMRSRIE